MVAYNHGQGVALAIQRSRVRIPAVHFHVTTLMGKLFTHMCLCYQAV